MASAASAADAPCRRAAFSAARRLRARWWAKSAAFQTRGTKASARKPKNATRSAWPASMLRPLRLSAIASDASTTRIADVIIGISKRGPDATVSSPSSAKSRIGNHSMLVAARKYQPSCVLMRLPAATTAVAASSTNALVRHQSVRSPDLVPKTHALIFGCSATPPIIGGLTPAPSATPIPRRLLPLFPARAHYAGRLGKCNKHRLGVNPRPSPPPPRMRSTGGGRS